MQSRGGLLKEKVGWTKASRSFRKGVLVPLAIGGIAAGTVLGPVAAGATTVTGANATVVLNGKTYKLSGGACVITGTKLAIGIGSGSNSLGLNAVVKNHKFSNAQVGLFIGGQPVAITSASGTVKSNSGTFKGTDVVSNSTVTGKFSCS